MDAKRFNLTIETDNEAFVDSGYNEVARILREVAQSVEHGATAISPKDINGNTVGYAEFEY